MNWELIFAIANGFAAVAWLVLIFGPRGDAVFTWLRDGAVGLLCLLYAVLLGWLMFVMPNPGGGPDFTTLEGVGELFATKGGLTLGWIHYLAFDLFAGLWVASTGDAIRLSRIVQAPILLATFLFGPFGLLIFLCVRRLHLRRSTG